MKQLFIFILFLPLLGCGNIIKNKQTSIDFNCPRVFFSSEDRVYIDNSISFDDIAIRAEFNNFEIKNQCVQEEKIVVIPLDILIVANSINDLEKSILFFPVYVSLLDDKQQILETQYFSVSGSLNKSTETNKLIESDITYQLQIVTKHLDTSEIVIGFMLDEQKRKLLY